ncbi:hypothetical protein EWM64_g5624 [Hericium alpestre]|uniref:Cyclin N-terminal domain-containing protein n=1 Tax=Hericium alpestre TaxID=135208 RepID=A0A4Y9ZY85_9AGAM|nr:hypothetical protein EWM64_g5624 [Hericium alpestre]
MSPRVHSASLVDPASHSPAILELIDVKLDRNIIEYLIDTVVETVDYALGRPSHSRRGRSLHRHSEGSSFATTVKNVLQRAEVEIPVVLATLVYLDRAKPHLHITLEEWANERVFLGALIVASKYLNDSSLKNVHWAVCTGLFGRRDIGRIEREFLDVLDWELAVSESDILAHHHTIMSLVSPAHPHHTPKVTSMRESQLPSPASSCGASPSMSVSTDASFSPRTPPTLVNPEFVPVHVKLDSAHAPSDPPAPLPAAHLHEPTQAVHPPSKKHAHSHSHSASGSSTLRLLRAFPLPHFGAHHPSQAQQQSNPNPSRCQPVLPSFPAQPSTQVCV